VRPSSLEQSSAEALHKLSMRGKIEGPEETVLYVRALTLQALGREEEASGLLEQARVTIKAKAEKIEDLELRERFQHEIPLNRKIMETGAAT
jgi:hypothetical protein